MTDSIGEVAVDVVADMTAFEAKLKKRLKAIAEKERLRIAVQLALNTKTATSELTAWIKRQSLRSVNIGVKISKKGLAVAGSQLKALTGVSALGNEITGFSNKLQGFFTNLPSLARTITLFSSLGSVGVHALGALAVSIASMGPAVAGLGAALLAIPGILAGFAASIAVIVTALKDAPSSVKRATKSFSGLRKIVSGNFWAEAESSTTAFLKQLGPQVKAGMAGVATQVGGVVGSLLSSLKTEFDNDVTGALFANIAAGAEALKPAMAPVAAILRNLLQFGTSLLPGISTWLTKIATQFSGWLQNAMETGQLNAMLSDLGTWLKAAGSALGALGSIINGISTAAINAGIGGLFAGLEQIATIVNSPAFQTALTQLFVGAKAGSEGLLAALTPIGNMLAALMPVISGFLAGAGQTFGALLSGIADEMAKPVFQNGLSSFFEGILNFLKPLLPVLPQFVDKLAAIGSLAGGILSQLGPIIAKGLEVLIPVLDKVLGALEPVVAILGPALMKVVEAIAPLLNIVVDALTPILDMVLPLIPMIADLASVFGQGLAPILKVVGGVLQQLVTALMPVITALLDVLMPILQPLMSLLSVLLGVALKPLVTVFQVLAVVIQALSPVLTLLAEIIGAVIGTIVALFEGDFTKIGEIWSGVWDKMVAFFNDTIVPIFTEIGHFFTDLWAGITDTFNKAILGLQILISSIASTITGIWEGLWNGIRTTFETVWTNIGSFFKGIANTILGGIETFVNGAITLINGLITGVNDISSDLGLSITIPKIPKLSIPRLAAGATILPRRGGTAAILGEGGRAESVVDTGLMNKLLRFAISDFPKQVAAMNTRIASRDNAATAPTSSTRNITNNFPVPLGADPARVAQEFVDRAAEKAGL